MDMKAMNEKRIRDYANKGTREIIEQLLAVFLIFILPMIESHITGYNVELCFQVNLWSMLAIMHMYCNFKENNQ